MGREFNSDVYQIPGGDVAPKETTMSQLVAVFSQPDDVTRREVTLKFAKEFAAKHAPRNARAVEILVGTLPLWVKSLKEGGKSEAEVTEHLLDRIVPERRANREKMSPTEQAITKENLPPGPEGQREKEQLRYLAEQEKRKSQYHVNQEMIQRMLDEAAKKQLGMKEQHDVIDRQPPTKKPRTGLTASV